MANRYVTVTNRGSDPILVGAEYLHSRCSRRIHRAIAQDAKAKHGDNLQITVEAEAKAEAKVVEVQTGDDLTVLTGVGAGRAGQLNEIGITTFVQLAAADEALLTEEISGLSHAQAKGLIVQAREIVEPDEGDGESNGNTDDGAEAD